MQQQHIKLGGLDISFPYVPYGIQKAMLAKIAVALTNKEHALIESPTGTGKSLSLLCSALAWRLQSKQNNTPCISSRLKTKLHEERRKKLENRPCSCGRRPDCPTELDQLKEAKGKGGNGKGGNGKGNGAYDDCCDPALKRVKKSDSDEVIEVEPTYKKTSAAKRSSKSKEPEFIVIDSDSEDKLEEKKQTLNEDADEENIAHKVNGANASAYPCNGEVKADMCRNCEAIEAEGIFLDETGLSNVRININRIPKIFYGTRTHKQISQVVRELNKTDYTKDLRMNILSSRDRTCINDDVKNEPDRNDRCQELIKSKSSTKGKNKNDKLSCSYYKDSNQMGSEFENIYEDHDGKAWDIEDSVRFGLKTHLCPYYGLRALQEDADITFCPYNYLLDTNIRSAMNINLKNAVIILDEAHNIEDICRESASITLTTSQIDDLLGSINRAVQNYIQGSSVRDAYDFFRNLFTDIKAFLVRFNFSEGDSRMENDCLARCKMEHQVMMNSLQSMQLGSSRIADIKENLKILRGDDDDKDDKSKKDDGQDSSALGNNELQIITQLVNTLDFIYANNAIHSSDFRCIISKHMERTGGRSGARFNKSITNGDAQIFQLSIICMNSGIAFQKIHENCWSVIVASGTLSPIESLKTELGCTFSQIFEGSHVIEDNRIFATILSAGPKNVDLNCSYQNSLRLDFQDELGRIVLDVCGTIPNGILVFFPSYDRMENLYQRWFSKGYIMEIQNLGKKIFREQRSYTAAKFEEELRKYYKAATGKSGAVMMAVYRGKISEGIDFSDEAARAVISIGIPYPNVKEVTIDLKKEYNDLARRERPELMTGRDWYSAQAFRALNQALGRVIRHKEDWGSIIMLDSRLKTGQSMSNISKWIRRCVSTPSEYEFFKDGLEQFVQRRRGEGSGGGGGGGGRRGGDDYVEIIP